MSSCITKHALLANTTPASKSRRKTRTIKQFARNQEGIAFLEFAIATPFLIALLMGAIEVTRYILIVQKIEKVTSSIADIVSQGSTISEDELDVIILAASEIMKPYEFEADGYVIITSVKQNGNFSGANPPRVNWQYRGGGNWLNNSRIGSPSTSATLPNGLTIFDKENVIVTEVFYRFRPLLVTNGVISDTDMYKVGVFKPRLGDLSVLMSAIKEFWHFNKGVWS